MRVYQKKTRKLLGTCDVNFLFNFGKYYGRSLRTITGSVWAYRYRYLIINNKIVLEARGIKDAGFLPGFKQTK
jgi:hypothetical protein